MKDYVEGSAEEEYRPVQNTTTLASPVNTDIN
jgi:hypothetical protein